MSAMHHLLTSISEIENVDLHIDSDHELEEMQEKMNFVCEQTAQEFYKIKAYSQKVTKILEENFNNNFTNKNFNEHELIEEKIDELIFQYAKAKELIRKGREIKFYKEEKEKQIKLHKKLARNALAHYGIQPQD